MTLIQPFRLGLFLLFATLLLADRAPAQAFFNQQGSKLVGSGAINEASPNNSGANQGTSLALSADGNTALIGGPGDNGGLGAAWVFIRNNPSGSWTQQGSKLMASDAVGNAMLGQSVALSADGNTALIGGPGDNNGAGAAWVFTRSSSGTWTQQGSKLVGSGAVMVSGTSCVAGSCAPADLIQQGWAVALSADGNTALESGKGDNNYMGAVWVFTRSSNGSWSQQGNKLVGTGAVPGPFNLPGTPNQGYSVALSADGNTAAVGGPYDGNYRGAFGAYSGAVWVFTKNSNGQWSQQGSKLIANNVIVDSVFAEEGTSVALSADGNTLLTGGPEIQQGAVAYAGEAWVFTRDGNGNWSQQGSGLLGTGEIGGALQGESVALSSDGNTALVGGPYDSGDSARPGSSRETVMEIGLSKARNWLAQAAFTVLSLGLRKAPRWGYRVMGARPSSAARRIITISARRGRLYAQCRCSPGFPERWPRSPSGLTAASGESTPLSKSTPMISALVPGPIFPARLFR